jgi:predicted DNA-binding protein with PD1-like motif
VIVGESRKGRRLVGRLNRGSEILDGLADACRVGQVRSGELRARGALEQAVVQAYDQRARTMRPPRRFESPFEIVYLYGQVSELSGRLSLQAHVALSREGDNGIELVGGRLVSGRVFAVEFVIDAFDDLVLRLSPDAQTGLPLWSEAIGIGAPPPVEAPEPPPPPPPAATDGFGAPPAWQEVVAASDEAAAAPAPEPDVEVTVRPGDLIDHPKFGRCQVERIEGDYEFVSARLKNQRLIRLSLDVLSLIPVGEEDGHQLFRAVPGR